MGATPKISNARRCAAASCIAIGLAILAAPLVFSLTLNAGVGSPSPGVASRAMPRANMVAKDEHVANVGSRNGHFVPLALGASASAAVLCEKGKRSKSQSMPYAVIGVAVSLLIFILSSSTAMAVTATGAESASAGEAIKAALVKAWQSGRGGFLAGVCQVVAFMWLRTAMNYQYKNGGSLPATLSKLWAEGGIRRLYQGLFPWAILQAPLSRFGDTAANQLVIGLRAAIFPMIPLSVATVAGSFSGAAWRVIITPIDTCKTTLQTDGAAGWGKLMQKVNKGGIGVLWYGWEGNYLANVVGNYPFFVVYNMLAQYVPMVEGMWPSLMRLAFIGAVSATVSDVTSNSIRVVKTKKQTSDDPNLGYMAAATDVIKSDGFFGFMFRGLDTRIFTNILQGAFFTVLWKGLFSS